MDATAFILASGTILSLHDDRFIVPVDFRPAPSLVSNLTTIPIIYMNQKQWSIVEKISYACKEYGAFQIVNHGVPKELCQRMLKASHDFFSLEKSRLLTNKDKTKPLRVTHFHLNENDNEVTMWRESLATLGILPTNLLICCQEIRPNTELATEYAKEIGWLVRQLLYWISQGLGLNRYSLQTRIGEKPTLLTHANYYPPCPKPDLTLGARSHSDMSAIKVLLQEEGVSGLQVFKDGRWLPVDPIPNALVVSVGDQIEVMSNGRYKSARRRVVTNKDLERASIAMFYGSNMESVIAPVNELVDEEHPPLYRHYHYQYAEFAEEFKKAGEVFKLRN